MYRITGLRVGDRKKVQGQRPAAELRRADERKQKLLPDCGLMFTAACVHKILQEDSATACSAADPPAKTGHRAVLFQRDDVNP